MEEQAKDANDKKAQANDQPVFHVERIYLKDLSWESPNSPEIFTDLGEPKVEFNLDTSANKKGEELFEVTLNVTVTVKNAEKTLFLVEIAYSGLFVLKNFNKEQMDALLGIECPTILFPYARRVVSDVVTEGGFKPLVLDPINFAVLFQQARAEERAKQAAGGDAPKSVN